MITSLRIQVLVENRVNKEGVLGEHGFALDITGDGKRVLFDTGFKHALKHNSGALGFDLAGVEKIVLSHGHLDHTGGLGHISSAGRKIPVYAHPDLFNERYSVKGAAIRSIGIPFFRRELEANGLVFLLDKGSVEVLPGLATSGEIPRRTPKVFPGLVLKGETGWVSDPLLDDQFLLADTAWGYVLILGCAHAGLQNTLAHAQTLSQGKPIRAILGGLHLVNSSEEEIAGNIDCMKEAGIEYCFPAHCTGFKAACLAYMSYQEKFAEAAVGNIFDFHGETLKVIPWGI